MYYCFIINGREDKTHIRGTVDNFLNDLEEVPEHEIHITTAPGEATTFVRAHAAAHPGQEICYVACGGDGTIKEVASGIVGVENKFFTVLAYGSGNDFVKYYPGKEFRSLRAILDGTKTHIDAIKVAGATEEAQYSVNVTNFGFDSVVGSTGARLSTRGWKNPYRWGIVAAIITGRFNSISVTADSEKLGGRKLLLCTLANNQYVGGEFFCAPRAKNDDGLIDICLVKTMTLMRFLKLLPVYTAGRHLDGGFDDKIIYRQARKVTVEAPKPIWLCLDGEMLQDRHFDIELLPASVGFIIPA